MAAPFPISAVPLENPPVRPPIAWLGKGLVRVLLVLVAASVVAAVAAGFGIAHNYGYLHASILTGSPSGQYYALATRLADRAKKEDGTLTVVPTAGSIENVERLTAGRGHCAEMFALIQDGTPVSAERLCQIALRHQHLADLVVGDREIALPAGIAGVGPHQAGDNVSFGLVGF